VAVEKPPALADSERGAGLGAVPSGVWALGFVSLFMDVSSEMIHALLPLFLVSVLGASAISVGLIEGVAESTASVAKLLSGALSDRLARYKLLAALGYALSAATKPAFALAPSVGWVLGARFVDRVGKGIRGAPRDALVAELSPPQVRGGSFGLRQALDTVGAIAGPLLATVCMAVAKGAFRTVFWLATLPAFMAVALMLFGVREPEATRPVRPAESLNPVPAWRGLPAAYWWVVAIGGVLTLARFSEAFLILRARSVGLDAALAPLVLVAMNVAYAGSSYPAGRLSDRVPRLRLLRGGFAILAVADLVLARAEGPVLVLCGVLLWGLHMGVTQGLLSALVADTAPWTARGTAFGIFNLVLGLALFIASILAGWLWQYHGASSPFLAGGVLLAIALLCLEAVPRLGGEFGPFGKGVL
jgi:MFS family permease